MSDEEYNVESGKGYLEGASEFKPVKVELKVANVNTGSDRISFEIGSPSMEDLTANDSKFRMEEYLTMNVPPFELRELQVQ